MAHKVGRKIKKAVSGAWDAYTGQVDPNDLQSAQWTSQDFNPEWTTTAIDATYVPAGDADTYQDFEDAETSTYAGAPAYDASLLGAAQGYTAQGYGATTGTAAQGQATLGQYQTGEQFQGILGQAMGAAESFMDPGSAWQQRQIATQAEMLGQQMGQSQAQQNAMLASRGMGGGGLRDILGSQAQATAGEQTRLGATNIATQGAGLGLQALGQAGSMATSAESNMFQQALANQQAQNQMTGMNVGAQNQMSIANLQAQNQAAQFTAGAQNTAAQFGAGQQNQFSLANQAAQNAASQFNIGQANTVGMFNAGQENTVNMFNTGQETSIGLANSAQINNMNQFNAGQQNAMNQFNTGQTNQNNQFNASNQMNYNTWNQSQSFAADQFNASQSNALLMGNAANNAAGAQGLVSTATDWWNPFD